MGRHCEDFLCVYANDLESFVLNVVSFQYVKNHSLSHLRGGARGTLGASWAGEVAGCCGHPRGLGGWGHFLSLSLGFLFSRKRESYYEHLKTFGCRTFSLSKRPEAQRCPRGKRQRLRCRWGLTARLSSPLCPTPSPAPGPAQTPAQGRALSGVGTLRLALIQAPGSVVVFRKCLIHSSKRFRRRKARIYPLPI